MTTITLQNQTNFSRIIAVTNRHLCTRPFMEQIERICSMHPRAIILREKDLTEQEYYELAREVLTVCEAYQVDCILHNFPEAARALHADKIHLPLQKLLEYQGTAMLQDFSLIGASTHSLTDAAAAQNAGASYVTAGHIYITDCKKGLAPRGLDFLREICRGVSLPVYGIGGIKLNPAQIQEVENCGASGVCIMSEMMKL
ncbi:MAG: thiamine phosphate synthase [Eubacteriales bacterium]|nr:thiamine phosphate synthase [Eubacteriales bacterium]